MNKCFVAIVLCLVIFSCDDETNDDSFCKLYSEGRMFVETNEDVSIEQSFDLANEYDLGVEAVYGHYYEAGLPGDSIRYVLEYLNSKDYINSHGFKAVEGGNVYLHPQTQALTIRCNLWDMTLERQQDWIETKSILKLTEEPGTKSLLLIVPNGQEKELVTTFTNLSNVRTADVNCILRISN